MIIKQVETLGIITGGMILLEVFVNDNYFTFSSQITRVYSSSFMEGLKGQHNCSFILKSLGKFAVLL